MGDIVQFLRDRLDEDQATAEATGDTDADRSWHVEDDEWSCRVLDGDDCTVVYDEGNPSRPQAVHIAHQDPARTLRQVAAHRRIVDRCAEVLALSSHHMTVESCDEDDAFLAQQVLRDLAAEWSDHPDFDPSWTVREADRD